MKTQFNQPQGSTSRETNKEAIARIFGIKKSEVGYLSTTTPIDSYVILFDKETQTCWYRGTATGTPVSWTVTNKLLNLTTSNGSYVLVAGYSGDILRQDLASSEEGMGGFLVDFRRSKLSTTIKTVAQMLNAQPIYCYEFADEITDKPDESDPTTWDWTPAIDAAIAASKRYSFQPVVLPHHSFVATGGHVITSSSYEFSGGSATDGRKYKGVPIIGYGPEISKARFKPSSADSKFISLVGNGGGHKSAAYLRDFSIEPYDASYQLNGYGIEYNCVGYVKTDNVHIYMLNENFRLLNGIANGWTEFNTFIDCFSYRGNVCYSFVRTLGNDSFNGCKFIGCFGQIKKASGGGYGIKATGVSPTALVWLYGSSLDIKFYGGDELCKVISLKYAEMTLNSGDIHCEGTVTMEALDDYSRCQHRGRWLNNGTTAYSVVNERTGAQGRFTFQNANSRTAAFSNSNISAYTPDGMPVTPDTLNNNGTNIIMMTGHNYGSPMLTCRNYAGNGFYFGTLDVNAAIQDVVPSWRLSNDGGVIKSYNDTVRFQLGSTETFQISTTAVYPHTSSGMQLGTSSYKWDAGYFEQFTINDTGLIPTATAKYNIGSSSATVNNIYTQNAVTVVSDKNFKSNIAELSGNTEYEALVAAIGTVAFSIWQLKAAVVSKGESAARWHVGVIAQQVKSAITDAGLDWTKYGLITYESFSQEVTKGDDGYYYPVVDEEEASEIPVNASGYIDAIDGADSVITADDGAITYTREIYMLRMEEFFVLRMAYIESKLS